MATVPKCLLSSTSFEQWHIDRFVVFTNGFSGGNAGSLAETIIKLGAT